MNEANRLSRLAKQKAEYEAEQERLKAEEAKRTAQPVVPDVDADPVPKVEKVTPDPIPTKQWVAFQALLSTEDALALKEFFNSRNIEFKAV